MKFRINEQEDESGISHSRSQLDLLLTPEGCEVDDVIKALENRDFYGKYLINTRNDKKEVEAAIIKHFGPNLPTHRLPLEKKQGFKFPPKTKQAMEDLISKFNSKPNLLTYEKFNGGSQLIFPSLKNNSQLATTNILKVVLGNAGLKYKLEKFENLKEYSKPLNEVKRMKELAGLK